MSPRGHGPLFVSASSRSWLSSEIESPETHVSHFGQIRCQHLDLESEHGKYSRFSKFQNLKCIASDFSRKIYRSWFHCGGSYRLINIFRIFGAWNESSIHESPGVVAKTLLWYIFENCIMSQACKRFKNCTNSFIATTIYDETINRAKRLKIFFLTNTWKYFRICRMTRFSSQNISSVFALNYNPFVSPAFVFPDWNCVAKTHDFFLPIC